MNRNKMCMILISIISLSGCSGLINNYSFSNEEFSEGGLIDYSYDKDMVVDGLEDDNYQNSEVLEIYDPEYDITLSTKTYFGENGLYFYCYCNDSTVFYNRYENAEPYNNDGIEMHICVDPSSTLKLDNLSKYNKIDTSMIQIRTDVSGKIQTWVGNNHQKHNLYVWTQYYKPIEIGVNVDGKINKVNGAKGYSIEIYCPYSNFGLDTKPDEISIMPAFNNANDDSFRKWFSYKGMSHDRPSSWMHVLNNGQLVYKGKGCNPSLPLLADENNSKYDDQFEAELIECNEDNENEFVRATHKMFLAEDGVYGQFIILDKELSRYADSIYDNDGVEFFLDTVREPRNDVYGTGIYRFVFDVDNGLQTDISMDGFNDTIPCRIGTSSKVRILDYDEDNPYGYTKKYIMECFIPYESIGVTYSSSLMINTAFAYKSPGESSYMLKTTSNPQEARDLFYIDRHFPWNPNEYFWVTSAGLV